ncbi:MAG: peptide-methionine (S)-S-oxide reductase MsrA [Gammaproteobacteria bacterium]|nr:peptide-methionine (S)-S-oxide reductase MsrA [Gammaproteobacteria bacterium]
MFSKAVEMPSPEQALPGRQEKMKFDPRHFVHGRHIVGPFAEGLESIIFGMGCFWGAERKFWSIDGVFTTAVGYSAGLTPNPTYREVCSGLTGHNEVVLVVYDPVVVNLEAMLKVFWESHDPTQGMRQGNDRGTQYRSGIYYYTDSQREVVDVSLQHFQSQLNRAGYGEITTEVRPADEFFYAEEYHQQYLEKNPTGYCGLDDTGVSCS